MRAAAGRYVLSTSRLSAGGWTVANCFPLERAPGYVTCLVKVQDQHPAYAYAKQSLTRLDGLGTTVTGCPIAEAQLPWVMRRGGQTTEACLLASPFKASLVGHTCAFRVRGAPGSRGAASVYTANVRALYTVRDAQN